MKILEKENKLYFDISEEQKNLENADKILEDIYNEYYKNICQTVDHLTIERTNGQIMAEQSLDAIAELSEAIPNLIKDFLMM